MSDRLQLLAPDGLCYLELAPPLTPKQRETLLAIANTAPNRYELRRSVRAWADQQELQVSFRPAEKPAWVRSAGSAQK